jgi:hypothetical protein
MTPVTITYRVATLISEGRTSLPEVEQYTPTPAVFKAWLAQMWKQRNAANNVTDAGRIQGQNKDWKAIRPAVVAMLSKRGSMAAQLAAVTPEQEAEAWRAIGVNKVPTGVTKKQLSLFA